MTQEDQTQRHINSSSSGGAGGSGGGGGSGSGGRSGGDARKSCNKSMQKKVPQRGLGVAQLEKIRIQEHMKENAAYLQPPIFLQPPNSAFYSGPRQHGLIPSIEAGSNSMSTSGSEMGWPGSCSVCVRWPNLQGQCQNLDYHTIQSNIGLLPCNLQHPTPSPMVNIPAGTSKAPMWNFQPQPPPNHGATEKT